ncbi:hydroxyisourate hydrolase [Nocardia sp. BMG111209]|uniref:hydroxyisourate hydrolase n=1 Tax=Nocardia sp. BMG111209 TaxID=1160137 RepID=UPI000378ACDB|nr:hydroxyisourate hydrolase [Nocardia sp. BMG111209]
MSTLSTHVLDAVRGGPAVGVTVTLFGPDSGAPGSAPAPSGAALLPGDATTVSPEGSAVAPSGDVVMLASAVTDADGRIPALGGDLAPGLHRLRFETGDWFAAQGIPAFYPEVTVAFTIGDEQHHHVPLLLSPFAYSTYRGS